MFKFSMNGVVIPLEDKKPCTFKDMVKLLSIINERYNKDIKIESYTEDKKIISLIIDTRRLVIVLDDMTQYNIFMYIYENILIDKTAITKHDLIKAKETFNKLYKKEECLTNGEYWSLIYMLKFIDLLIKEVK